MTYFLGRGYLGGLLSTDAPDPIVPADGTQDVKGNFDVTGNLEVGGSTNHVGGVVLRANTVIYDNIQLLFGTNQTDALLEWSPSGTNHRLVCGVSDTNALVLCEFADAATDWGEGTYTDPTLRIQSNDATTVAKAGLIYHDETNFVLGSLTGEINLAPVAGSGVTLTQTKINAASTPAELLTLTGAAHGDSTPIAASTEATDVLLNFARTVTFATGALALQRAVFIDGPTYAFAGASTITDYATLYVEPAAAGSNCTITNNFAAWFAGDVTLAGNRLDLSIASDTEVGEYIYSNVDGAVQVKASGTTAATFTTAVQTLARETLITQAAWSSGTHYALRVTGAAMTSLTNADNPDFYLDASADIELDGVGAGPLALFTNAHIKTRTIKAAAGDPYVITQAAGLYVDADPAAGANITLGASHAILTPGKLKAGGVESTASLTVATILHHGVTAGITASTTQSQGQGALTTSVNEVSTCANLDDVVTLPTAVAGAFVEVINNGANTLQIFPASGDNLGAGANTSVQLEPNESITFIAYDATNWKVAASTEIIHAEMTDSTNTDAFVVNDTAMPHCYHTNGLAAGDLASWTFDAGGAGTSVAITAAATAGGGTSTNFTTGAAHNLAVGDVVSVSNSSTADPNYDKVHVVSAVADGTHFEVVTTFGATCTATMDQAATLTAGADAAGVYYVTWNASATSAVNNEIFDFVTYIGATAQTKTETRRKFGTAGDYGSLGGGALLTIAAADKVSWTVQNNDSAGNITVRDLNVVLVRL
jgi:hypothetical protein